MKCQGLQWLNFEKNLSEIFSSNIYHFTGAIGWGFGSQSDLGSNLISITSKLVFLGKLPEVYFLICKVGIKIQNWKKNTKLRCCAFLRNEICKCFTHSWCSINVSFFLFSKYARVGFAEKWYVCANDIQISQTERIIRDEGAEGKIPTQPLLPPLWKLLNVPVRICFSWAHSIVYRPQWFLLWLFLYLCLCIHWRQCHAVLPVPFGIQFGANHKYTPHRIQVATEHMSEISCSLYPSKSFYMTSGANYGIGSVWASLGHHKKVPET